MNTTWFKAHRLFTIALLITIVHFVLTSVIGHYIAIQIGTQMGQVVAGGLIDASEKRPQKSGEEANRIYQNMKNKSNNITERWKIPLILMSLPANPLMAPCLKNIRKAWLFDRFLAKEISKEQFKPRGMLLDYAANFVNSLSFGLLLYIILRIFNYHKFKHNNSINLTRD
jgi:hypothetical protein